MRIAFDIPDTAVAAVQRYAESGPSMKSKAIARANPPAVRSHDDPGNGFSALLEAVAFIVERGIADPAAQQRVVTNALNRFHAEHTELFKTAVGIKPML